jgi:hypothetical protein
VIFPFNDTIHNHPVIGLFIVDVKKKGLVGTLHPFLLRGMIIMVMEMPSDHRQIPIKAETLKQIITVALTGRQADITKGILNLTKKKH